jgi:hypothetical protein
MPTCRRSEGRAAGQPEVGQPPFFGDSLAGIACAKDLVGGVEDALGGSLGEGVRQLTDKAEARPAAAQASFPSHRAREKTVPEETKR